MATHTEQEDITLKQMGARPLRFRGALLVEGKSKNTHAQSGEARFAQCRVAVFEAQGKFIAQISLQHSAHEQDLSFLQVSDNPIDLRNWFAGFNPTIGISAADLSADVRGQDLSALEAAEMTLKQRLIQSRDAYYQALHDAFGAAPEDAMAA